MNLITDARTKQYFDKRLEFDFDDDHLDIIETFVKCIYEPYYAQNADLPSISFHCVHNNDMLKANNTDRVVYVWYRQERPTIEDVNEHFDCNAEPYESYNKYCDLSKTESMGWIDNNQYIFWVDPFDPTYIEYKIAIFLVPLFDFICTPKDIKGKFKAVIEDMSQGSRDRLQKVADKIVEEKGLKLVILSDQIRSLARYKDDRVLENLKDNIEVYSREYNTLVRRTTEVYADLLDFQRRLSLYNNHDDGDLSALVDILTKNTAISKVEVGTSDLSFMVCNPITQYDEDAFAEILKSENSTINNIPAVSKDVLCCMVDGEIDLLTGCLISIDLQDNSVRGYSPYRGNYITHPHLGVFNCFGGFEPEIEKALVSGDICYAIQLILTASQNLNFMDSAVICNLGDVLAEEDSPCIMDKKTGEVMTVNEWKERK